MSSLLLERRGTKQQLARQIIGFFPRNIQVFNDLFFGAGGMLFEAMRAGVAKYYYANDACHEVFNLFMVVKNQKQELTDLFFSMPISEELFYYWKDNPETEPVAKALRFLLLSNLSFMNDQGTFLLSHYWGKIREEWPQLIDYTHTLLAKVIFRGVDFRDFIDGIRCSDKHIPKHKRFIYADPPYLGTNGSYGQEWTAKDLEDLVSKLVEWEIPFALSEKPHKLLLDLASQHQLYVTPIGRSNQKIYNSAEKWKEEIILTNYQPTFHRQASLF